MSSSSSRSGTSGSGSSRRSGGSSGSNSSDTDGDCDCLVIVDLLPLGGAGCGTELTNGIVYSVGTQFIGAIYSDPCDCVKLLLLNGFVPPVLVRDGGTVDISIIQKPECIVCKPRKGPFCTAPRTFLRKRNSDAIAPINPNALMKTKRALSRVKKV